ncbi:MAG TPA: YicC/YloC family endoribonuclease, partial [Syntrophales bacterium]|nr:YicC/YloC family endoribonuclease [Syntrophales bacterium]
HRYLEISIRVPAALSPLEIDIKKRISQKFSRGRIEATIRMDSEGVSALENRYELNLPLIRNYYALLLQLRDELKLEEEVTLSMMTGFRDVFVQKESGLDVAAIWEELQTILDAAMDCLVDMRKKEGQNIRDDLVERLSLITKCVDEIGSRAPQVVLEYKERLAQRVKELALGIDVDELRLQQEVAIMAEKSDISEEIVRLCSHIVQFRDLLESVDAVGRSMDFLIQEMIREVNTIGSKSSDAEISRKVIDIKSELSRIREQVQNIE